ncbi:TPA_asm: UL28.6 [Human alphaherpesvirus 1]|nr:TPA_asm: UL28.6 [Human alphaherpesvirus 1]
MEGRVGAKYHGPHESRGARQVRPDGVGAGRGRVLALEQRPRGDVGGRLVKDGHRHDRLEGQGGVSGHDGGQALFEPARRALAAAVAPAPRGLTLAGFEGRERNVGGEGGALVVFVKRQVGGRAGHGVHVSASQCHGGGSHDRLEQEAVEGAVKKRKRVGKILPDRSVVGVERLCDDTAKIRHEQLQRVHGYAVHLRPAYGYLVRASQVQKGVVDAHGLLEALGNDQIQEGAVRVQAEALTQRLPRRLVFEVAGPGGVVRKAKMAACPLAKSRQVRGLGAGVQVPAAVKDVHGRAVVRGRQFQGHRGTPEPRRARTHDHGHVGLKAALHGQAHDQGRHGDVGIAAACRQ